MRGINYCMPEVKCPATRQVLGGGKFRKEYKELKKEKVHIFTQDDMRWKQAWKSS